MAFDRGLAYGKRLDIPAGTAVRFEPGDSKTVILCGISGKSIVSGGNALSTGPVDLGRTEDIVHPLVQKGFTHVPQPRVRPLKAKEMDRAAYVAMFGPTVGDRLRLGDTGLYVEVEWDAVRHMRVDISAIPDCLLGSVWGGMQVRGWEDHP